MPELPEVETVRQTLQKLILGKTIRDIDVFYEPMIRSHDVKAFRRVLEGTTFIDINRYGKYLLFELDDYILMSHLRMEGKYFIKDVDAPRDKHEHVVFYFTDGSTLRYQDTRKFGTFDLYTKTAFSTNNPLRKMGPEPGSEHLTISYLKSLFKHKTVAIKTALLDQSIISGLGNIYVNEVLFLSALHPETPCNRLRDKDIQAVINNSDVVIRKAIQLGGSSIRSYTDSLGVTGRFQNELYVHTRENESCYVCNTTIKKIVVGGRGTYFCPTCQTKRKKRY
jgi:formamidopyrimidine-DNA glycosylase